MLIKSTDRLAIYTAVIDDYDKEIVESTYKIKNADLFLISNTYNVIAPDRIAKYVKKPSNIDKAFDRFIKMRPDLYFQNYRYSLWLDGHISIIGDIREMINNNIPQDKFTGLAFLQHPNRNCIYQEAFECIKQCKDSAKIIQIQINRYKREGMPYNNGLIRGGVIFREHNNPIVVKIMENWWNEVFSESVRDQISFNYVIWVLKAKYNEINKRLYTVYFKQHKCHNTKVLGY